MKRDLDSYNSPVISVITKYFVNCELCCYLFPNRSFLSLLSLPTESAYEVL